ncbi:MAG TPA: hypothetical protein VGW11_07805, partial [Solirubrobacteraceae bacterium]|nr:hypothetical protein [Solirubrobacteraceae bacterium]
MPDYLKAEIAHARELGFADPRITRLPSARQRVELVEGLKGIDLRVYLDGEIQCSSDDEYRYHELLVHPAMALPAQRVLVVGGGTGNVVRELIRYLDLEQVVLVDPDEAITAAAATHPALLELNGGAMADERVEVVHADATRWVHQRSPGGFDVAVLDLPDPATAQLAGLYSAEFLRGVADMLLPGGRMVAQACSPWLAPRVFWCQIKTVRLVRERVIPLWTHVPSFGEWGFHLSSDDEYRYHELLVHPAMALPAQRVLVVGGGTGNVVRELIRYPDLEQVVLVDPDEAITAAAATHPAL